MKRTLKISGAITIVLCLLGSLFKFQHWPGAGILLLASLGFFALVFIPLNIIMKFKDEKEKINKLLVTFGFILGMGITLGMLFKIFHWPWANKLMFGSLAIFGLIYIPLYFFTRIRNPETKFNAIVNTTFMVAGAGLLFGMINLKPTNHIEESVESMDAYQSENIQRFQTANSDLYMEIGSNSSASSIQQLSNDLNGKIELIKANLISKSNGISIEEAMGMGLDEVNNPDDVDVIVKYYQVSNDEYSHKALEGYIDKYNNSAEELDNGSVIRPIQLDLLQMENTLLSVVLHELLDIQVQVLSNENSYLCLQKGLLATK